MFHASGFFYCFLNLEQTLHGYPTTTLESLWVSLKHHLPQEAFPPWCFYLNCGPSLLNGFRDHLTSSRKPASFSLEKQAVPLPCILAHLNRLSLSHTHIQKSISNNHLVARTRGKFSFLLNKPHPRKATSPAFRISPALPRDDSGALSLSKWILTLAGWWASIHTGYLGSSSARAHLGHGCPSRELSHSVMKSLCFRLRFPHSLFAHFPKWRLGAVDIPLRSERKL